MNDENVVGWYRFKSSGGWKIPETVVPVNHCSGKYPGWLDGPHPNVGDGEVLRKVCFNDDENRCNVYQRIWVKNCIGYFVYLLWPATYTYGVYCTDPGWQQ
ncbi:pancreatic secretory granule membrane major glycoprotein GP2-like [Leucoraja erinacea]|uniref:pancreatic secretory granule membrane major glycoprotein GP2-like n=1 Tax=Leucoraja erinaceus TaxID=7782 RepID=UPI0024580796|nr:pancreatic secretory granule membrane major glycoprotein GP2-like [Leucoraja erinacea]